MGSLLQSVGSGHKWQPYVLKWEGEQDQARKQDLKARPRLQACARDEECSRQSRVL